MSLPLDPIARSISPISSTSIDQLSTSSLKKRTLPAPEEVVKELKEHKMNTRTTLARAISTSAVSLGFLAGVGLGVLSGLALIGTLVTPVGWIVLGSIAVFAVVVGASEGGVKGALEVLRGAAGGMMLGFTPFVMYQFGVFLHSLEVTRKIIWGCVLPLPFIMPGLAYVTVRGGIGSLSESLFLAGDRNEENRALLNLRKTDYGIPENKEKYQEFLKKCLSEKEVRHLSVDDNGKLKFISQASFFKERLHGKFRTYTRINQKVIELQFLKFLSHGVKQGWLSPIPKEQQTLLLKRIGLTSEDENFKNIMGKIAAFSNRSMTERDAEGEELDSMNRAFFEDHVRKIAESHSSEDSIVSFYLEQGNLNKKSDPKGASYYFSQALDMCGSVFGINNTLIAQTVIAYLENGGDVKKAIQLFSTLKLGELNKLENFLERLDTRLKKDLAMTFFNHGELEIAAQISVLIKDYELLTKVAQSYIEREQLYEAKSLLYIIKDINAFKQLAEAYRKKGDIENALYVFRLIRDTENIIDIANSLTSKKEYEGAIKCYAEVCRILIVDYFYLEDFYSSEVKMTVSFLESVVKKDKRYYFANIALNLAYEHGIATPINIAQAQSYKEMAEANKNSALVRRNPKNPSITMEARTSARNDIEKRYLERLKIPSTAGME